MLHACDAGDGPLVAPNRNLKQKKLERFRCQHVRASIFHVATHVATCIISLAVARENWPRIMTFLNIFPTIKSFCRNLANFRNKCAVEHSEFSVLESLFPRFLGRFLAREMGRTCFYHMANDTAGCIETSLLQLKSFSAQNALWLSESKRPPIRPVTTRGNTDQDSGWGKKRLRYSKLRKQENFWCVAAVSEETWMSWR